MIYFITISNISRIIILLMFWANANAQGFSFSQPTGSCNTPGYECTITLFGAGWAWFQPKLMEQTRYSWAEYNKTTEIIAFYPDRPWGYSQSYVSGTVYKLMKDIHARFPDKKFNIIATSAGYPALIKLSTLIREGVDIQNIGKIVINNPAVISPQIFLPTIGYRTPITATLDFGDAHIDQFYYFKAPEPAISLRFGEPSSIEIKSNSGQKIDFFSIEMPVFEINRNHSWFSWFDGDVNYNRILSPSGVFNKHTNAVGRGEYITGRILRGGNFQDIKEYINDMVYHAREMSKNVGLLNENVHISEYKKHNDKYNYNNDNFQKIQSIPSISIKIEKPKPPNTKRNDFYDDQIHNAQSNNRFPPPSSPGGVSFEGISIDSTISFKKDTSLGDLKEKLLKNAHQQKREK